MAIRIGLPPAVAPRLHVGWSAARQSVSALVRTVQLTAERLVRAPFNWVLKVVGSCRRRFNTHARVRRRQYAQLKAFDDRYEQMVDLLCLSAQNGSSGTREARYKELRQWIRSNYDGSMRLRLRSCWADPTSPSVKDPFDSLISFDRVEDVLSAYSSIEDMMLCRKALDGYKCSLDHA